VTLEDDIRALMKEWEKDAKFSWAKTQYCCSTVERKHRQALFDLLEKHKGEGR